MGLKDKSHEKTTFLNIVQGEFAKRVSEGTPNAIQREIEYEDVKKTVWETRHESLSGIIKSIEIKEDGKFGDQLLINLQDGMDVFTVSLGLSSREAKGFMLCLPNIDVSEELTLSPYNYERKKDGKKMIGLGITQESTGVGEFKNVPYYYTNENGLPHADVAPDEKLDKDEFKILMAQITIFLKKETKKWIALHDGKVEEQKAVVPSGGSETTDDLPFRFSPNQFKFNL